MKRPAPFQRSLLATAIAIGALSADAWRAEAAPYIQTDLVSDIPGLATLTEPTLVNPWGISHSASSPFWISNQVTNTTNLWAVTGQTNITKMTAVNPPTGNIMIPPGGVGAVGPTGQVNNGNLSPSSFPVLGGGNGGSAHFIFANLNGTISAWDTGPTAFIQATTGGAVYTGLAINQASTQLYAANDAGAGSVDVFNTTFGRVMTPGAFATPTAVSALGLVPFNVQDINGKVYVEYAPSGRPAQQNAALGAGAVVVFNEDGSSPQILVLGSDLAAPWGVALASAGFGPFGGDLLVGNFSYVNSEINAYNPTTETTGAPLGTIPVDPGTGQTPGGLWALNFGIGGSNGDPNTLYITDGIDGETHGLFAALTVAVPEPSGLALLGTALALFGIRRARSRRKA
jgi:uncharacterized protein (TIGR03118 family)